MNALDMVDQNHLNKAYLSLGSNIEPENNLVAAVRHLANFGTVLATSNVWESPPAKFAKHPNFLNAAVILETRLEPTELQCQLIQTIETSLGRHRDPENKNGSRTIDIDLVLFNQDIFAIEGRRVPSPEILEQAYVAVPLAELDPCYIHTEDGRTLRQIAIELKSVPPAIYFRPDVNLETITHDET